MKKYIYQGKEIVIDETKTEAFRKYLYEPGVKSSDGFFEELFSKYGLRPADTEKKTGKELSEIFADIMEGYEKHERCMRYDKTVFDVLPDDVCHTISYKDKEFTFTERLDAFFFARSYGHIDEQMVSIYCDNGIIDGDFTEETFPAMDNRQFQDFIMNSIKTGYEINGL